MLFGFSFILCLSLLASVHTQSRGPPSRFPIASGCLEDLENSNSSCISCSISIIVDSVSGIDCSIVGGTLAGRVCDDLDDVIQSIIRDQTSHNREDCIEVLVKPKADTGDDTYLVQIKENVEISWSVVFRGMDFDDPPKISFVSRREDSGGSGRPGREDNSQLIYALRFTGPFVVFNQLKFIKSPGIIGFDNVGVLFIQKCSFRFFTEGAIDAYNTNTVLVLNTNFSHNLLSSVTKMEPYRGHSAGLSIGYGTSMIGPLVRIIGCVFRNNSVESIPIGSTVDDNRAGFTDDSNNNNDNNNNDNNNNNNNKKDKNGFNQPLLTPSERFDTRGQIFQDMKFVGRGGGAALIINAESAANVVIRRCEFIENTAVEFGGGMYVLLQGPTSHSVTVIQSRFLRNVSPSSAGGLHVTFLSEGAESEANQVLVYDTLFSENRANFGGGVFFLPLTLALLTSENSNIGIFARFEHCRFTQNAAIEAGGALGVAHTLSNYYQVQIKPLEIMDCIFHSNSVSGGGIVSIANFPASFLGTNIFDENRGPSLAIIGSLVRVYGSLQLRKNSNTNSLDGGALYITSLGQLEFNPASNVLLKRNTGEFGAAIVINNIQLSPSLSQLANNPLCSFLFSERTLSPDLWGNYNVSLTISNNSALVSSGVYVNNINLCSWRSQFMLRQRDAFRWDFISYIGNVNKVHGNPQHQRFAVQTPPISVGLRGNTSGFLKFPGERINLRVVAYDELGLPTSAVVGFLDDSTTSRNPETKNIELYRLSPSSVSLKKVDPGSTVPVQFSVQKNSISFPEEDITIRIAGGVRSAFSDEESFTLAAKACPPGYKLHPMSPESDFSVCQCNTERADILKCIESVITKDDLLWGYSGFTNQENDSDLSTILTVSFSSHPFHTFPCPSRYCSCEVTDTSGFLECAFLYDRESPDDQCQCNRSGILCGNCDEGLGFSVLLNNCVSCNGLHTFLALPLVIADVIIVLFLLIVIFPLPPWLYPIIYYLQILPHLTEHFPVTFEKLSPYGFYIASALGLYFPYDFCLYSNMDAVLVYALRYIPILVTTCLVPIILFIRIKKFRPCDWHGVWSLLLFLYTPLLHTSMTVLNCPALKGDSSFTPRWYINGNIKCFQDIGHVFLGLFSIGVIFCSVGLIPIVMLIATKKITRPHWVHYLEIPLTYPYKNKYRWWCGVELGKRVILVLFAVSFKNNDYAVIFSLIVLLTLSGFLKPYKSMIVNIFDILYAVDIFVLLCLRNTVGLEEIMQIIPEQDELQTSRCDYIQGFTSFVGLLVPFYYFPILLAILVVALWICWFLYKHFNLKIGGRKREVLPESIELPARARTQTVFDMNEYDDSPTPAVKSGENERRRFSLKILQPHMKYISRKKSGKNIDQKSSVSKIIEDDKVQDSRQSPSLKGEQIAGADFKISNEGKSLLIVSAGIESNQSSQTESTSDV